ncbi:ribosome maturation factor RimM [Orrella daihaiensis]|uniref:Ribosome maturation factor RimM n=1 Tax=Orrella daihaiensis TaxID=2782176 RepID=A0ABY4APC3_9BURK|nr:ribosome maturation factor RimM [Orrella daihaiensis]UOD51245.1 ribosome maturation factor RimM [Orrella daihaiensis]
MQATPSDLVELGRVLGAHGIKGWIKVQPFSSDSEALGAVKRWWLRLPQSPLAVPDSTASPAVAVNLVWAKPHGANWIACVRGLNDRDEAQALKGNTVMVPRGAFPKLDENEYYWVDLIGCSVTTDADGESEHLGVVESVQDNPAHPILVVRQQHVINGQCVDRVDDKDKAVYSLIPFVAAHVGDIDTEARIIETHWPRDF